MVGGRVEGGERRGDRRARVSSSLATNRTHARGKKTHRPFGRNSTGLAGHRARGTNALVPAGVDYARGRRAVVTRRRACCRLRGTVSCRRVRLRFVMTTDPAPDVATVVGEKMSPSPVELPESTPSSPVLATPARDREVYPRGVTELTPELRAALPTSPLASWSLRDVAACVRVLGREFAREEGESRSGDVEAFDRYADTFLAHGIDGEKLSCVTIAQLSGDLGVRSYEHRFKVVEWVKRYLEVRSPPTFPRLPTSRRSSTLAARDERFLDLPRVVRRARLLRTLAPTMSPIRRKLAVPLVAMDYLASALGKLADIVDAPPFDASFDVRDELHEQSWIRRHSPRPRLMNRTPRTGPSPTSP